MGTFEEALENLRRGKPVLVFDSVSREGETDITFGAQFVTSEAIRTMRKDGGGLICVTMPFEAAEALGLDYTVNIYSKSGLPVFEKLYPNDIPYDEKSAFSITINHRKTFTGISDIDRALTVSEFAKIVGKAIASYASEEARVSVMSEFGKYFRTPGHVHTLIASKRPLVDRKGHTELTTVLATEAGIIPSAAIVEMLGDNGKSLAKDDAMEYAALNGLPFVEGKDIIEKLGKRRSIVRNK
ncbi:MAG: 3,4-dihydroxy-2-butanone-4-phosphate synthase [Candidatus Micrarchaeaceae archaeon]